MKVITITDQEFKRLSQFIKRHSGISLKDEKKALLVGRLANQLESLNFKDFSSYYDYLQNDPDGKKLNTLVDKVTTNHTYFMRETEHFNYFVKEVLPFLKNVLKSRDLRIWCAASSSGQEPYTLAILLDEFFKMEFPPWDKRLLATDISLDILKSASEGIYKREEMKTLPKAWVLNYFEQLDANHYQVKKSLKEQVIFRRFNLLEERYPFKKKFHAVFLRNVMIYFDMPTKEQIVSKMYNHIEYGGYLFIGHSENIPRTVDGFKYIQPAVYRKI